MIAPKSFATRPSHQRLRKSFDHSPILVFYELTQACDLVCLHCRACAPSRRDPAELSTEDSRRLIDQLTAFPDPPMLTLALAGSELSGVGVPGCIESGRIAAEQIAAAIHGDSSRKLVAT